jgi:hypothetical protein
MIAPSHALRFVRGTATNLDHVSDDEADLVLTSPMYFSSTAGGFEKASAAAGQEWCTSLSCGRAGRVSNLRSARVGPLWRAVGDQSG